MSAATKNKIIEILQYAILLQENGELPTSGYYAAAAFEKLLPNVEQRGEHNFYEKRIDKYCKDNDACKDIRESLNVCRKIRNEIIHGGNMTRLSTLLSGMCEVFDLNSHQVLQDLDAEDFRRLRKKISAFEVKPTSPELSNLFSGFCSADFRNLLEMRNTLSYLREALSSFCESLNPPIYFDTLSDTVSSYVWLAGVKSLKTDRPKIDQPSLSILATNHDLRIYIDFGGRCKDERKKYYTLLFRKELDKYLAKLSKDFCMFDTYWYSNLENIRTIQEFSELRDLGEYVEIDLLGDAREFSSHVDSNKTITENKFLIGRIFSINEVINMGIGITEEIKSTLSELHPLYSKITY